MAPAQPQPMCSGQTRVFRVWPGGVLAGREGCSTALGWSHDGSEPRPCLSPGPNLDHELHSSGGGLVPCRNVGLGGEAEALGTQREFQCALLSAWSWKAAGYFGPRPALALRSALPSTPALLFLSEEKKNFLIRERPKVMAE